MHSHILALITALVWGATVIFFTVRRWRWMPGEEKRAHLTRADAVHSLIVVALGIVIGSWMVAYGPNLIAATFFVLVALYAFLLATAR